MSLIMRQWAKNSPYGTQYLPMSKNNPFVATEIARTYDNAGQWKQVRKEYINDKNGNVYTVTERDWDDQGGNPGPVFRVTENRYVVNVNPVGLPIVNDDLNEYWQPHNTAHWSAGAARRLNAISRKTISNGSAVVAATDYDYDYPYSKGTITAIKKWDDQKSSALPAIGQMTSLNAQVTTRSYDEFGNAIEEVEAKSNDEPDRKTHITYNAGGNLVQYVYEGYANYNNVISAMRTWQYGWDTNGTAVTSKTDVDNNLTISYGYDAVGRQTSINEYDIRQTTRQYEDANRAIIETMALDPVRSLISKTNYDELGRVSKTQKRENSQNGVDYYINVKTKDTYLSGGRRVIATSPYRDVNESESPTWSIGNEPTLEWKCTQYDQAGRVTTVATFKGSNAPTSCSPTSDLTSIVTNNYGASSTKIATGTSEQKATVQQRDGLGRITSITENPDGIAFNGNPTGIPYVTSYSYNALDKLTGVTQSTQGRSFQYSSLGRLMHATNPENGTIDYAYYDSGDLKSRTDARGTNTMTYDSLHRILSKGYPANSGTPNVSYSYHTSATSSSPNIGKLWSISSSAAATSFNSYNQFGNVLTSAQAIDGYLGNWPFSYTWYLNGALKSETYPSGFVVNYDVDLAGRTTKVYSATNSYADTGQGSGYKFAPDGRILKMKYGNATDPLWGSWDYRPPMETTYYKYGNGENSGNLLQLEYNYDNSGNRNIANQTTRRTGYSWQQAFTYDPLNRISNAAEGNNIWTESFTYDQWGNLSASSSGLVQNDTTLSYNTANNRISGVNNYDTVGNQTSYNGLTLGYDAENRNTSVTGGGSINFGYDGEGRRVKKAITSGGLTDTTFYVYDALGRMAVEKSSQSASDTRTKFILSDMLGSVRAVATSDGMVQECYDYLPYGRMLTASDNGRGSCYPPAGSQLSSSVPQKFTGKERDAETGLDYFIARYYSGAQGRFNSPDPFNIIFTAKKRQDLEHYMVNPQQWNKYAYAINNPVRFTDPAGKYVCQGSNDHCNYVKTLVKNISTAAEKLTDGSKERKALEEVVRFYGEAGKNNGVVVTVKTGDLGNARTEKGITYIEVDVARSSKVFSNRPDGSNPQAEGTGTMAHEGEHGIYQKAFGMPRSRGMITATEHEAYSAQGYVNEGLGVNSAYGIWTSTSGWDESKVDEFTNKSVESWCNQGGDCK